MRSSLTAIAVISVALALSESSNAATLTAEWDPTPNATGYILYYGLQSGAYTNQVDVGNLVRVPVAALPLSTRYYFVVRAYNSAGKVDRIVAVRRNGECDGHPDGAHQRLPMDSALQHRPSFRRTSAMGG